MSKKVLLGVRQKQGQWGCDILIRFLRNIRPGASIGPPEKSEWIPNGVFECLLEVRIWYLTNRRKFLIVDVRSVELKVTGGAPQVMLWCPLLFCMFVCFPEVLFLETLYFCEKSENLATERSAADIQTDMQSIEKRKNKKAGIRRKLHLGHHLWLKQV